VTFIESVEEEPVTAVTLTHLLAQARTAEIARTAERAAMFEPATKPDRRAAASRWWAHGTRPATGSATAGAACSPVPCCA
jgi:hypothetical protein